MKRVLCTCLAFLLCGVSCNNTSSEQTPLDDDVFVDVYVSLLLRDPSKTGRAEVFARLAVTEEQFRASVRYHNEDVRRWAGFYRAVVGRIESGKVELN